MFVFTNEELRNKENPRWQAYWSQFRNVPSLRKAYRAASLRLHPNKQSTLHHNVFSRHTNLYKMRLNKLSQGASSSSAPAPSHIELTFTFQGKVHVIATLEKTQTIADVFKAMGYWFRQQNLPLGKAISRGIKIRSGGVLYNAPSSDMVKSPLELITRPKYVVIKSGWYFPPGRPASPPRPAPSPPRSASPPPRKPPITLYVRPYDFPRTNVFATKVMFSAYHSNIALVFERLEKWAKLGSFNLNRGFKLRSGDRVYSAPTADPRPVEAPLEVIVRPKGASKAGWYYRVMTPPPPRSPPRTPPGPTRAEWNSLRAELRSFGLPYGGTFNNLRNRLAAYKSMFGRHPPPRRSPTPPPARPRPQPRPQPKRRRSPSPPSNNWRPSNTNSNSNNSTNLNKSNSNNRASPVPPPRRRRRTSPPPPPPPPRRRTPPRTNNINNRGCVRQTSAKYTSRPSPPYSANEPGCRGTTKRGNDGVLWESRPMKNGVHVWRRV